MPDEFRKKLIEDHMEMAGAIASECLVKYKLGSLLQYDDLLAYARAGLVEAAHKYDPGAGAEFRSYSWTRIKGAVLDGVRKNSRYSRSFRGDQDESDEAVTARPGIKGTRSLLGLDAWNHLPTALTNAEDTLPDRDSLNYSAEDAVDARRLRATLLRAVEALPTRDRDVILRHYFRGEPMKDIAQAYGFHEHTIVRFHCRSLSQLRQALSAAPAHDAKALPQ